MSGSIGVRGLGVWGSRPGANVSPRGDDTCRPCRLLVSGSTSVPLSLRV